VGRSEGSWVSDFVLGFDGSGGLVRFYCFPGFGRGVLVEVAGVVWQRMDCQIGMGLFYAVAKEAMLSLEFCDRLLLLAESYNECDVVSRRERTGKMVQNGE